MRASTAHVGTPGQEVGDVLGAHEGDVAPGRALQRADRRAGVGRLLRAPPVQRRPEEARDVGIAGPDGVHHPRRGLDTWAADASAIEHHRAVLAPQQNNRRLRRQTAERFEYVLRRAGDVEHGARFGRADEEVADARQQTRGERPRLDGRPEGDAVVDVVRDRHRLLDGTLHEGPGRCPQGRRDAAQVHEACLPERRPLDLRRRQSGERRIPPVVEDTGRPRCHTVLEEVDTDARAIGHADVRAIHPVCGELAPDPLAPRVGRQRRHPRRAQAESRAGRRDIGLGAADQDVELPCRLETRRRRHGQTQHHFAEGDEIVHSGGLRSAGRHPDVDGRPEDHRKGHRHGPAIASERDVSRVIAPGPG